MEVVLVGWLCKLNQICVYWKIPELPKATMEEIGSWQGFGTTYSNQLDQELAVTTVIN